MGRRRRIRPTEDAAAVTQAFADGVQNTGAAPLALLLDNKPSNHGEEVYQASLFAQEAPAMTLTAKDLPKLAMQIAALVVTTWARAVNHRPRADRQGKSRHQLYREASATPEPIAHARAALLQRQLAQLKAQKARQRRHDPIVRALLDAAFERLGLADPEDHLRNAIAAWPRNPQRRRRGHATGRATQHAPARGTLCPLNSVGTPDARRSATDRR